MDFHTALRASGQSITRLRHRVGCPDAAAGLDPLTMLNVVGHMRLVFALLATLSYLGLGVAMARGDGTMVIDGQIVTISDLCGLDDDGSGCPFCTLGKAADFPAPAPIAQTGPSLARPSIAAVSAIVSTAPYIRPPVRAPPLV